MLHVITPSRVSGAELLLLRTVRAHGSSGVTSRVICKPHPEFEDRAERESVDVAHAPISGKVNLRAVSSLCAEIRAYRPDLVCTHLSSASLWGTLAARLCHVPCVSMVHGFNSAFCYRFAPKLVCVSHAVAGHMISQRIGQEKVCVVHNGIDPAPFLQGCKAELPVVTGDFCVGIVAHLSAKKGLMELMAAIRQLPECHFVLTGEGALRPALTELAQGPLQGRLHLLGFRDDIPALMRRFDLLCLPSHREPFGLVLLEAMAAGRPVVAFDAGGVPEIVVSGQTGLLAPPGDFSALSDHIESLRRSPESREAMGVMGRRRVLEKFTLARMTAQLYEVFAAEIRRQRRPSAVESTLA